MLLSQAVSNLPSDTSALERAISALESSISAFESSIKSLEISSGRWELAVWPFTLIVVVGVVMEFWVINHDWDEEMEAWALTHFDVRQWPLKPSRKKWRIEVSSIALIAIGVAGELGVGIRIATLNGEIRGDDAALRSANAELRIKSDKLISLINLKRAALQRAIVENFGPRHLTDAKYADIVKHLSGLRGVKIDVYALSGGTPSDIDDSLTMGRTVLHLLRDSAHMDAEGWVMGDCHGDAAAATNVVVFGSGTLAEQVLNAFRPNLDMVPKVDADAPLMAMSCSVSTTPLDMGRPNKRRPQQAEVSITIRRRTNPSLTPEMLE